MTTSPDIDRLSQHPTLPRRRLLNLIEKAQAGDSAAENVIVRHHVRLATRVLRDFDCPQHLTDDLFAIALLEIRQAVHSYCPDISEHWITYAYKAAWRKVYNALRSRKHALQASSKDTTALVRLSPNPECTPDEELIFVCEQLCVDTNFTLLSPREQHILSAFYGLFGDEQTLVAIGADIGISGQRAGQIRDAALRKLREALTVSAGWQPPTKN